MATIILGQYKGHYRNSLIHEKSNNHIITDAPIDNQGKGEAFSPTDLVAAALASCMITIISIKAKSKKINIGNPSYSIKKHMSSSPRKISKIEINICFKEHILKENRAFLEKEAQNCPVALSLNDECEQKVTFNYL